MSVSGVSNNTSTTTKSSQSLADLSQNYETFLRLLTAQLQNQDPLQPQDTAAFTNQLVQFSQVEQQIASNSKLDQLISSVNNGQVNQAISYIGKTVEIQSNGLALQDGSAKLTVAFDTAPADASLEIRDAKTNKLLRTMPLPKMAGTHDVTWDGKNDAGEQLKDGTYVAKVNAFGTDDKELASYVMSFGKVTGVDMTGSEPYLMLGDLPVSTGSILSIK